VTTVRDIADMLEEWAPHEIAWEQDNTGIQCGNPSAPVRGILVALEVTEKVIREARRRHISLIVTHHPLLFRPLSTVNTSGGTGRLLEALLQQQMALIAAHTNIDFARGGTSFALAEALGLQNPAFLVQTFRLNAKIVTFVPPSHVDRVANAMSDAGAGTIGNYAQCSFRLEGTGTFLGTPASSPTVGTRGVFEHVPETRLEMQVMRRDVPAVVRALKNTHPYEEVACDVYPIENPHPDFGMGVIGNLRRPATLATFLGRIRRKLGSRALRYCGAPAKTLRSVAVCGGSGADLLEQAINSGADAFVTADVKYHAYQEASGRIALIDAGHYETELPVVAAIATRLHRECLRRRDSLPVRTTTIRTSPIAYV
jgi:dinuclear metal center YbgI/SA1388 family protein